MNKFYSKELNYLYKSYGAIIPFFKILMLRIEIDEPYTWLDHINADGDVLFCLITTRR